MYRIRWHKPSINRGTVLYLVCILCLLWICGVFDHLLEKSFDDFQWPPFGIDVLAETRHAMSGKPMRAAVENDLRAFRRIASPLCRWKSKILKVLIIVKSSVYNRKQRDAIRKTWGAQRSSISAQTFFIIGKSIDGHSDVAVQEEISEHGDLLFIDWIDSYRNNTYKLIHSLVFAVEPGHGCQSPEFLFLVDDDYMVNVEALIKHVSEEDYAVHLYEGWRFDTTPFRVRLHKHAVPLDLYPFDRYPPYISAGAVLLSRNTFTHFYHAMQLVKIYPFDDIYAGILAHLLRIPPRHNEAFVFWNRYIHPAEWKRGDVIACHGYTPNDLLNEFSHIFGH